MRYFTAIILFFLLAQSCKWVQETEYEIPLQPEKEITLIDDFEGDYYGIMPCVECAGIRTTLVLKRDSTYKLNMDYTDKKAMGVSEQGKFSLSNNIITISYADGKKRYFLIEEGKVHSLDNNKNRVEGIYSVYYTLIKQ